MFDQQDSVLAAQNLAARRSGRFIRWQKCVSLRRCLTRHSSRRSTNGSCGSTACFKVIQPRIDLGRFDRLHFGHTGIPFKDTPPDAAGFESSNLGDIEPAGQIRRKTIFLWIVGGPGNREFSPRLRGEDCHVPALAGKNPVAIQVSAFRIPHGTRNPTNGKTRRAM